MLEDILVPYISEKFKSDPRYRAGHIRIINPLPGRIVLGLHLDSLKEVARTLARSEGGRKYADAFGNMTDPGTLYYEDVMVWGLMLAYMKLPLEERLSLIAPFVQAIDNWAVCDSVCCASKWASPARKSLSSEDRQQIWAFLERWWSSSREFEVRYAVIMSMCYFLDDEWFPEVCRKIGQIDFISVTSEYTKAASSRQKRPGVDFDIVRKGQGFVMEGPSAGTVAGESPYYVRMAVAWLLATALARMPEETRKYAAGSPLPADVLKMYVRKARESFRTRDISPF